MFERSTVFIVGAGASKEVNLPVGSDLTGTIASKVDIPFRDGWKQSSGDRKIAEAVRMHIESQGERDPNPYFQAGRGIAVGMHQAISIHNYLHAHALDDQVTFVGKLGIAASILEAERASLLWATHERDEIDLSRVSKSWFIPFFQMLHEGVQEPDIAGIFDQVSFITFNYDRCIEHYLSHALSSYYRLDLREAEQVVNLLRIEHPYGQVGRLPWQNPRGATRFGKDFHPQDLPQVASQIRSFTERIEDGGMIARAKTLIAEAEVVVYLGFSYGDMNMKLLTLDEPQNKIVFGTSYGLSGPNKRVIEQDIKYAMGADPDVVKSIELADLTCFNLLNDYRKPILRGI